MTTTISPSAALAVIEPAFSEAEKLALAGFLAGYSGMTREAYALDLRQFTAWCRQRQLRLFAVRRADIELFARDLESAGSARATITRRLSTIADLYRYAVEEDLLDHSPAVHVRRPWIYYESHATGLDRNEVGALLVAAGLGTAAEHALVSLLALNGLRVSEATGADIEALGTERGHRTPAITRKGGKKPSSRSRRAPRGRSTWLSASAPKDRSSPPPPASGAPRRGRARSLHVVAGRQAEPTREGPTATNRHEARVPNLREDQWLGAPCVCVRPTPGRQARARG